MVMQNTLAEILSLVHIWVEHIQKIDHMHLPKKKNSENWVKTTPDRINKRKPL